MRLSPQSGGENVAISTITSVKTPDIYCCVKFYIKYKGHSFHLPFFSALSYSDFLFFNFFVESSCDSAPLLLLWSRSRLICFRRAPSIILSEVDKDWIFLGSSTPTGFMKEEVEAEITFLRDGARRSVPTPPLSKMACRAVLESLGF